LVVVLAIVNNQKFSEEVTGCGGQVEKIADFVGNGG
jgi:hypothetical protein